MSVTTGLPVTTYSDIIAQWNVHVCRTATLDLDDYRRMDHGQLLLVSVTQLYLSSCNGEELDSQVSTSDAKEQDTDWVNTSMMVCGLFSVFWLSFGFILLPTLNLAGAYAADGSAAEGAVTQEYNAAIALYLVVWGCVLFVSTPDLHAHRVDSDHNQSDVLHLYPQDQHGLCRHFVLRRHGRHRPQRSVLEGLDWRLHPGWRVAEG